MRYLEWLMKNRTENPAVELNPQPRKRVVTPPPTVADENATVLTLDDLTPEELTMAEEFFGQTKPVETTVNESDTENGLSLDDVRIRRL